MKLPGAWWEVNNAKKMLALKLLQVNGKWENYWENRWENNVASHS
ncbi:hypothetical protein WDW89_18040 [Deltaproteobacteria bacterium TL4]